MSEEPKLKDVLQGLKSCSAGNTDCAHCPYMVYIYHCRKHLIKDAHAVIIQIAKERDEAIAQLRRRGSAEVGHSGQHECDVCREGVKDTIRR